MEDLTDCQQQMHCKALENLYQRDIDRVCVAGFTGHQDSKAAHQRAREADRLPGPDGQPCGQHPHQVAGLPGLEGSPAGEHPGSQAHR